MPFFPRAVGRPAVRAKKEDCTGEKWEKRAKGRAGRVRAPKLRHFNLPVASREERERERRRILIDSSFPGGYPTMVGGRGETLYIRYTTYGERVCI